jgi:hypothetical protein
MAEASSMMAFFAVAGTVPVEAAPEPHEERQLAVAQREGTCCVTGRYYEQGGSH